MSNEPKTDDQGEVVDEREYYCPGCGARYETAGTCTGSAESSHEATPVEKVADAKNEDEESEHRRGWR